VERKILFATSNKTKVAIAKEVLHKYGIKVIQKSINLEEPQSTDIDEVALRKAMQISKKIKQKFIVDDSGIYIKALKKFPGALLKNVNKSLGDEGLLKLMSKEKDRGATFVNVLVFYDSKTKEKKVFRTVIYGRIARKAVGNRKTGWAIERIFIPKNSTKTIAQFNEKEWNEFWKWFKSRLHYNKFGKWFTG
jgi:XTP/dITP diphosphohydrolase